MSDRSGIRTWPVGAAHLPQGARLAGWAATQFAIHLLEQVAELLAPLLFVAGLGWWAVMHTLAAIEFDDAKIQAMIQRLPSSLLLDGHFLSPHRLITDGLWLMAVVAACRTATAVLARSGDRVL